MNKGIIKNLLPDYYFDKIISIKLDFFSSADLVIFDVDNTLIISETVNTKKEIVDWFNAVSKKYKCICLSNSKTIFQREGQISKLLSCEVFLSKYKKPFKKLFEEIRKKYNLDGKKIFIVGDMIFTDILFGNINNMTTVLVKPLTSKENILIKIVRKLEDFMLLLLRYFSYN